MDCGCGHTFLLAAPDRARIRHPAVCVAAGHHVAFVESRAGYDEYRCRDCGHTFGFTSAFVAHEQHAGRGEQRARLVR